MRQNLPVTGRAVDLPRDVNIMSTTTPQSHITYVNPDFIKISGFSMEELLQQPHNMVRHPDMPPAAFEQLWATLKKGSSWMGLIKNRCKNGDHYNGQRTQLGQPVVESLQKSHEDTLFIVNFRFHPKENGPFPATIRRGRISTAIGQGGRRAGRILRARRTGASRCPGHRFIWIPAFAGMTRNDYFR